MRCRALSKLKTPRSSWVSSLGILVLWRIGAPVLHVHESRAKQRCVFTLHGSFPGSPSVVPATGLSERVRRQRIGGAMGADPESLIAMSNSASARATPSTPNRDSTCQTARLLAPWPRSLATLSIFVPSIAQSSSR